MKTDNPGETFGYLFLFYRNLGELCSWAIYSPWERHTRRVGEDGICLFLFWGMSWFHIVGSPLPGVECCSRCRWQMKGTMRRCRGRKSPRISTECPRGCSGYRKRGYPTGKGVAVPARKARGLVVGDGLIRTGMDESIPYGKMMLSREMNCLTA